MTCVEDGPEIAIVTVALNAERDLPLTLESVLAQTYSKLRLMVVDGASWDNSDIVLRRYASTIDRLVIQPDAGIYHAMNAAAEEVTADYVLFLNAGDQFWGEQSVELMIAELNGRPDFFYGNHIYVDRGVELFKRSANFDWLSSRLRRGNIDHRWHSAIPGHQATFTSAAVLRELRYDTRLCVSADHELLFRAHAAGARMQYIDECVAHYHGGGFSALAGERGTLEGASVYRRFSDHPGKVDALFFPGGSPFVPQTSATGFALGGFCRLVDSPGSELENQDCWVIEAGAALVGPDRAAGRLVLRGWNRLDGQELAISVGDRPLGSFAVSLAGFRLAVPLDGLVAPGDVVTITPRLSEPCTNGERVGFALRNFQFVPRDRVLVPLLQPGTAMSFRAGGGALIEDLLGSGWDIAEPTHIWSLGRTCDLWLSIADEARTVMLRVSGNPHVEGGVQHLLVEVNGRSVDEVTLRHGEEKTIELDCGSAAWSCGTLNTIVMRLDATAVPPADFDDTRDLGLCLLALSVV